MKRLSFKFVVLMAVLAYAMPAHSQNHNPDSLFQQAQASAFASDYATAQALCKQILAHTSEHHDARLLLSSTYAWQNQYDTALILVNKVLQDLPESLGALKLKARILLWNNSYDNLYKFTKHQLTLYPKDELFLYLKALSLEKQKRTREAFQVYRHLLSLHPNHMEANEALQRLEYLLRKNRITLYEQYDIFFDAQSDWNLFALAYTRETKYGSIMARVNHAYRFKQNGFQYEIEAYPIFRVGTYAYINYGYADNNIFPEHRLGIEPYQRLPRGFEISAGVRYLKFATTEIPIYTGSLSKYYKNWWFSIRPYFSSEGDTQNQAYHFISRYYLGSSLDYLGLRLGSGITPDMPGVDNQLLESSELSNQFMIQASYQQQVTKRLLINGYVIYFKEQNNRINYEDRIALQIRISWIF